MNYKEILKKGIFKENPIFVQLIALCPLLAVTTSLSNAIVMGVATTVVMICANMAISYLQKLIMNEIRIAAFVVIVAGFVTILQLIMQAYAPPKINDSLGIFIPLIVVNCIVFARLEVFASKNAPIPSAIDALGMGIGFTIGLSTIAIIREILGSGTIFGIDMVGEDTEKMLIMLMAPGAFFTLGVIIMIIRYYRLKKGEVVNL